MADNSVANAGSGGDTFAFDDIGGVKYGRTKLIHGADGVNDGDVSDANPLPVDDAGGSLTVDNAHLTSLGGCVGGTEVQVDVVSSALPSGAATAAKQPALGTAGTASADVITVQGIASMTALSVSAASLPLPSGAATAANQSTANTALAAIQTAAEILDNAISGSEMQVDVVGSLPAGTNNIGDVDVLSIAAGDNNIGNVDIVTVPADPFGANADAASATGSISAKLRFIASTGIPVTGTVTVGSHAVTNAGTFAVQVDGAALTALQLLDDVVYTDEDAFTPDTSKVAAIGAFADESSPDSAAEGSVGIPRMTLDRQLRVTLGATAVNTNTAIFRSLDLDETEEEVKATAGNIYGYYFANTNASARYLKFYNLTAANTSVGTSVPVMTMYLPPTSAGHIAFPVPVPFSTALSVAATTGVADADTGAPSANDVLVDIFYA